MAPPTFRDNPMYAANTHKPSNTIYGVWSPGNDGSAWAAAENGTVFQYQNGQIIQHTLDPKIDYYDIFGFAANDIFAVGSWGSIQHYDGQTWSAFNSPTTEWLEGIWGYSASNFYVCGDEGKIFHFDGTQWTSKGINGKTRFYSMSGLDDGTVYVVGSFGYVYKISGSNPPVRLLTGTDSHLQGIQRISGTNDFAICGSKGLLLKMINEKFEAQEIEFFDKSLYGVEAWNDEVLVVGWAGAYALFKNGQRKKFPAFPLDEQSFLEGVVKIAPNKYFAAGWYGRMVEFSSDTGQWKTLHQGRVESVMSVAVASNGGVLATAEAGCFYKKDANAANFSIGFEKTQNYNIAVPLDADRVFMAANWGDAMTWNLQTGVKDTSALDSKYNKYAAVCRLNNDVYLVAEDKFNSKRNVKCLHYYKDISGEHVDEVAGFAALLNNEQVLALAAINATTFIVLLKPQAGSDAIVSKFDIQNNSRLDYTIPHKYVKMFGEGAHVYIYTGTKLLKLDESRNPPWPEVTDFNADLLSYGEYLTAGTLLDAQGAYGLGGSEGTLLIQTNAGNPASVVNSGCFSAISAINAAGNQIVVGFKGGRVIAIDKSTLNILTSESISGTHYTSVSRDNGGFVICGERGRIDFFDDAQIVASKIAGGHMDLLASIPLDFNSQSAICCAGAGTLLLLHNQQITHTFTAPNLFITSLFQHQDRLYWGTSRGAVMSCAIVSDATGLNLDWNNRRVDNANVNGPVVNLWGFPAKPRVITRNGLVYRDNLAKPALKFPIQQFTMPSFAPAGEPIYVAGRNNFLARIKDETIEVFDIPEAISNITMHGAVPPVEYWIGGSSGTLLLYYNKTWYKIHTGIGNRLHGIAEGGGRICVCGIFSAVRFDDSNRLRRDLGIPPASSVVARTTSPDSGISTEQMIIPLLEPLKPSCQDNPISLPHKSEVPMEINLIEKQFEKDQWENFTSQTGAYKR